MIDATRFEAHRSAASLLEILTRPRSRWATMAEAAAPSMRNVPMRRRGRPAAYPRGHQQLPDLQSILFAGIAFLLGAGNVEFTVWRWIGPPTTTRFSISRRVSPILTSCAVADAAPATLAAWTAVGSMQDSRSGDHGGDQPNDKQ